MIECIACGKTNIESFLDLGRTALANKFLAANELDAAEPWYPLVVGTCADCGHVQLLHRVPPPQMFDEYLYISSLSRTLVNHLHGLAATVVERERLGINDLVVDIGCNDGTLLAGFKRLGVRTVGVDPARNLQPISAKNGIESIAAYFGRDVAQQIVASRGQAAVATATNVFPHIPVFEDFLAGMQILLRQGGVFVLEAHYFGDLVDHCAFDTVYHEHVSYWSLSAARTLFSRFGFEVTDIARLPIHHGQLRLFVQRKGEGTVARSVDELLAIEKQIGLLARTHLQSFAGRVLAIKARLRETLTDLKKGGKSVVGYGAPAKGNTLITYLGLGPADIAYIADKSPLKQGRFTPGSHIPVVAPERLTAEQPDFVLLLAWNFADEIMREQSEYRRRGGKFILPVPTVRIV